MHKFKHRHICDLTIANFFHLPLYKSQIVIIVVDRGNFLF